jgi:hypothetical protein
VSVTLPDREFSMGTKATFDFLSLTDSNISSNVLQEIELDWGYKFLPANSL